MQSAFGVDHGYISKADRWTRDEKGRFAAAHAKGEEDVKKHGLLSDDDLDEQYEWYHPDYKSLHMLAEKDPKEHRKKAVEMTEDAHYWHGAKEFDLSDDIHNAVDASWEIHDQHHKPKPKKKVSKSYIPGKGWVKASQLSGKGKVALRGAVDSSRGARKSLGTSEQSAPSAKGRKMWEGHKTAKGKVVRVMGSAEHDLTSLSKPGLVGLSRPNGRGGGEVKVYAHAPSQSRTLKHEMAHITPKRNIVNFQQRAKNPRKAGREEGRADYIGNGAKTKGSYPGNRQFQRGYNEVQRKMHRAQNPGLSTGQKAGLAAGGAALAGGAGGAALVTYKKPYEKR